MIHSGNMSERKGIAADRGYADLICVCEYHRTSGFQNGPFIIE